jgi:hypothetical protein
MGCVALPVEDRLVRAFHRIGGKAQFDEGFEAERQQPVIEPVDAGPVVDRLALHHAIGAQIVGEDVVEADVAETQFALDGGELVQAVVPFQRAGKSEPIERKGIWLRGVAGAVASMESRRGAWAMAGADSVVSAAARIVWMVERMWRHLPCFAGEIALS